jgi:hypothetical protein
MKVPGGYTAIVWGKYGQLNPGSEEAEKIRI